MKTFNCANISNQDSWSFLPNIFSRFTLARIALAVGERMARPNQMFSISKQVTALHTFHCDRSLCSVHVHSTFWRFIKTVGKVQQHVSHPRFSHTLSFKAIKCVCALMERGAANKILFVTISLTLVIRLQFYLTTSHFLWFPYQENRGANILVWKTIGICVSM